MSNTTATSHINDMREHLLNTLADLRNRENPMDPDRARAVAQVAGVLVDSAKVEVHYLQVTCQDRSDFLQSTDVLDKLPNGITAITRHQIKG